ncbi:MAG: PfkB family carbohydrate kinase [Candidatus Aenigmatarchaeota archaeon]
MSNLIVVGSIGLDTIKTPFERRVDVMGGTAAYFSLAASFFTNTGLISIIGTDFPQNYRDLLKTRGANLDGVEIKEGKNFRFETEYIGNMDERNDISTEVNVLGDFNPKLPESYKSAEYVFLGNTDPEQHLSVLDQVTNPKLTALDTIKLWIDIKLDKVMEAIKRVDIVFLNEFEVRQIFQETNLKKAAMKCLDMGPKYIVVKKGEHGAILYGRDTHFSIPGYPLESVRDPTGAGDAFAGGFMGWIAKTGDISEQNLRKAMVYGSVLASFNTQNMGPDMLKKINIEDIQNRYNEFVRMTHF